MTMIPKTSDGTDARIALIGAYERDNFGDVLFLQLTRELLGDLTMDVTAPFSEDTNFRPLDLAITPFITAARTSPSSIWVVGGEAGGTSMVDAYRMAVSEESYAAFLAMSKRGRREALRESSGRSAYASPYIPRMSSLGSTFRTSFVINSAGLSGLQGLRGHRRDEAWCAVREAQHVSVRDAQSASVLSANGIPHLLAPDLVHTLVSSRGDWHADPPADPPYALIHLKSSVIRTYTPAGVAETLIRAESLLPLELRLFVAGTARGHDSLDLYQQVIEAARRIDPGRSITVATETEPIEKARSIARCSVWVGTSLHGLIISSSFEVPRVGLELEKLVRYARTWSDPMPVGAKLRNLDDAISTALRTREKPGRSQDMARQAMHSFQRGADVVMETDASDAYESRHRNHRAMARRARSVSRSIATSVTEAVRQLKKP